MIKWGGLGKTAIVQVLVQNFVIMFLIFENQHLHTL